MNKGRRGLAVIDVECAAVVQNHAHIVVAAKGVIPRQPINEGQWYLGEHWHGLGHLLLVGAPHFLGVDHGFGQFGGARGEQKFNDGLWPRLGISVVNLGARFRMPDLFKAGVGPAEVALGDHNLCVCGNGTQDGLFIGLSIPGKDQPWGDGLDDVVEFVVAFTEGRVSGGSRAIRHPDINTGQGQ